MKIITYDLNGIRASNKLGVFDWLREEDADIVCLQEVRADEEICKDILKTKFDEHYTYYILCSEKRIFWNYNSF